MKKGMEYEMLFVIAFVVLMIIVVGSWKYAGMSIASQRMSELKINTVVQIKNILLLMQSAPANTTACVALNNCNKINIHSTYIEIWGLANNYFKEEAYLSNTLAGNMNLYIQDESCVKSEGECNSWLRLTNKEGFVSSCGSENSVCVCFKKVNDKDIHIIRVKGVSR